MSYNVSISISNKVSPDSEAYKLTEEYIRCVAYSNGDKQMLDDLQSRYARKMIQNLLLMDGTGASVTIAEVGR